MLYGAAISNSDVHSWIDLPLALVAGKKVGIAGGRYVRFPETPLANLHLTILDKMGLQREKFGDSTGKLSL